MKLKALIPLLFALAGFANFTVAQNPNLIFTQFSNGTLDSITDLENAGDNRMFVVQQHGLIQILDSAGNVLPKPFLNLSGKVLLGGSEPGLLDMVFSPNYKTDGYFYVYYVSLQNHIHVARFRVSDDNPDSAIQSSEDTVLVINHNPYKMHYAGKMAFGNDGYLYVSIGDGGYTNNIGDPFNRAQNLDTLLGKIIRIDVSSLPYKIPPSNPFAGYGNYRPEIWSYGLRNPWCWSFDKLKEDIWLADVGMDTTEEIDFQSASDTGGENYGWRCYEGDFTYNNSLCSGTSNFTFPVDTYSHSKSNGCAVIGGFVYRGAQYKSLFGKYLYTDFCSGRFGMVDDSANGFKRTVLNIFKKNQSAKFGQDIFGELYIAQRQPGIVYKISDTACAPVAFISFKDTLYIEDDTDISALYGQGLNYSWTFNNNPIYSDSNKVEVDDPGVYAVTVTNKKGCSSSASIVAVRTATGLNKQKQFKDIQLTPNPNKGAFNLYCSVLKNSDVTISISDVLGRTLFTENNSFYTGKNKVRISDKSFSPGIYFVRISSPQETSGVKFVITE